MYIKKVLLSALLAGLAVTGPAQAHHSFPATFLVDQTVRIQGTVVQFMFRNPHTFVQVVVPDKDGNAVTWAVEWNSADTLGAANIKPSTIKPGDKVEVTGNPARDASHRLRMRSIVRPADGWKWVGTFG